MNKEYFGFNNLEELIIFVKKYMKYSHKVNTHYGLSEFYKRDDYTAEIISNNLRITRNSIRFFSSDGNALSGREEEVNQLKAEFLKFIFYTELEGEVKDKQKNPEKKKLKI